MNAAASSVSGRRPPALNSCLLKSTAVSGLAGMLFGFDTAVIAGTTAALTAFFHLSPASLGLTVAIALWGTIAGAMLAGFPGDAIGRRDSLRWLAVLFFASALGCGLAWSWLSFVAFRFMAGLAIGGSSVLGPMYIAEISPAKWRGRLVGFFQLNVVAGVLLAYFSNFLIGTMGLGTREWRWKLGVSALPAGLFFVTLFLIPRSPRWLGKKGRIAEARQVLEEIGEENVEAELGDIIKSVGEERSSTSEPLFTRHNRLPIFLAIAIAMFNQLSGINAIIYYLNDIFTRAGFSKVSGDLQAVVIGATNLLFTVLAMSVIDKLGRKTMLLIGSVGTCASLAAVARLFQSGSHQHLLIWPLIAFIGFFGFSQGAVIWVYISEIFPTRVRAKGQSLGCFTHWLMAAVLSGIFPMVAAFSPALPFVVFSAMMAVQFFVVLFLFPETKGSTLEELERKLHTA